MRVGDRDGAQDRRRRQRTKNWALVALLFALAALIYAVTIVRMSGG